MADSSYRAPLNLAQPSNGRHSLSRVAYQWDGRIRKAMRKIGKEIFPDGFWLGVIPVPQFRLRRMAGPAAWLWWIEHDIPPYDRFSCEAYQVELSLSQAGKPVICIRSGAWDRKLSGAELINFERTLALACREAPLIIHRNFGPVKD